MNGTENAGCVSVNPVALRVETAAGDEHVDMDMAAQILGPGTRKTSVNAGSAPSQRGFRRATDRVAATQVISVLVNPTVVGMPVD